MARNKKWTVTERSFGIYEPWSRKPNDVPQVRAFTDQIPCEVGIEFGVVVHLSGARGHVFDFRIDHPPLKDDRGRVLGPFTGDVGVRTNDWTVFLGDTVWEPWQEKLGIWTISLRDGDDVLLERMLTLVDPAAVTADSEQSFPE